MRPLETLLLGLNLLAIISLLVTRRGGPRAYPLFVVLAVLVVVVQTTVEGARWQMVPAYAVTMGLFARLLSSRVWKGAAPPVQGGISRLRRAAGIALGLVALTLSNLLPIAVPVFRFLPPSGPYGIGTSTYHLVDHARDETFTTAPHDRRELMVQIWYPAKPAPSAAHVQYLPDGAVLAPVAQLLNMPGFVFTHLKYVLTNAVLSAPVADVAQTYPVLIFSHGRGGFRQHNTFQVEDLVSHGYVVAAIDHPYAATGVDFPDGRRVPFDRRMLARRFIDGVIPILAQDVRFTLDQLEDINRADPQGVLTGKLDLQRIGIFGVSIGGAVAADACLHDARLKACLPMDNFMPDDVVQQGLLQPTMWISRDAATMRREGWAEADIVETQSSMRQAFNGLSGPGYLVLIPGMFHQNFSDFPFFIASLLDIWLGLDGPIDARRGHAIVNAYSRAFFDRHLKGGTATPLLDGATGQYPEVIFERRR
jgi:predicted dienelactone hydrolase